MTDDRRPAPADNFYTAMDGIAAAGMVKTYASWDEAIDAGIAADKSDEAEAMAERQFWKDQLAWCEEQIAQSTEIIQMIDEGVFKAWEGGGADRVESTAKVRQQNVELIERNTALAEQIRRDHPA